MKITLLFLLLTFVSACHTYEEGPSLSFRTAKQAIPGDWHIDSYTVDGADSMWVIRGLHLQGRVHFNRYATYASPDLVITTLEGDSTYLYYGVWSIDDKGIEVALSLTSFRVNNASRSRKPDSPFNQIPARQLIWKLSRLKHNKEMWLKKEMNGKHYELRFKAN